MAGANSNIKITELDFNDIKSNLKTFLKSQDTLKDYNYEGAALSTLLDVLAYNTQYNGFYLNMVANELFLDTAKQRDSVVSQAKILGYVPKSAIAASANVTIEFSPVSDAFLTLPKYTPFLSESLDGVNYNFVTVDDMTVTIPEGTTTARFENVMLKQGIATSTNYTVNTASDKFYQIPNPNVDITTLVVSVQKSSTNSATEIYKSASDYLTLEPTSKVYFLQEGIGGKYEIRFGDGVLGKQLSDGNIVKMTYVATSGTAATGANNFTLMSSVSGYSSYTLYPLEAAGAAGDKESIDSIRFQAPKTFSAQKRAVTKEDYISAIQQNTLGLSFDAVNVWGGEQNDPPVYGHVFISLKPSGSYSLTQVQKQKLTEQTIAPISVMTVEPIIVDTDYTYIKVNANVLYDPKKTNLTAAGIATLVKNTITTFASTTLNTFDSTFSSTDLMSTIKTADPSIITDEITIQLQKKFYPELQANRNYTFYFGAEIKKNNFLSGISSSPSFSYISDSLGTINDVFLEEVASSTSGVESISIVNPGFSYQSAPTVTIVGDGTGATATATINPNGTLRSITVNSAGSGYTSAYVVFTPVSGDTTGQSAVGVVNLRGRYGTLRTYYNNTTSGKTIITEDAGTIDYAKGTLTLTNFNPSNVNNDLGQMTLTLTPTSTIVSSSYNRIITIDPFDSNAITVNVTAKT